MAITGAKGISDDDTSLQLTGGDEGDGNKGDEFSFATRSDK